MQDLSNRVALLTGAAGGIGQAMTRALLEQGCTVVACDIAEERLNTLAHKMREAGLAKSLSCRRLDISDPTACSAVVDAARGEFGSLDILINNGAIGMNAIRDDCMSNLVTIDEISPAIWDRFVATNLSGAWYLTRAAAPGMRRAGWGRIITVTTSFFTMLRGRFHPYGPSKAALEAMSAGHAQEFEGTGITVNVIVPGGPADTPMVPASSGLSRTDLIPPRQMTYPLLWLCSTAADAVTGRRYVAAHWNPDAPVEAARAAAEGPIGWPELAATPVWPGGKPKD